MPRLCFGFAVPRRTDRIDLTPRREDAKVAEEGREGNGYSTCNSLFKSLCDLCALRGSAFNQSMSSGAYASGRCGAHRLRVGLVFSRADHGVGNMITMSSVQHSLARWGRFTSGVQPVPPGRRDVLSREPEEGANYSSCSKAYTRFGLWDAVISAISVAEKRFADGSCGDIGGPEGSEKPRSEKRRFITP
jgi:hypothetical protein